MINIDYFFPKIMNFEVDFNSCYRTRMLHHTFENGLYYSFRPISFRRKEAIILHTVEASDPHTGQWKGFWQKVLDNREIFLEEQFRYILIDSILEPYFNDYIARTWGVVQPGELPDMSTWMNTYFFDLEGL